MTPSTHNLIAALHALPARWVLALTGGGAAAAGQLLSVPGSARTLLEIVVPYHEQALAEFLGQRPDNYCNAATSQAMARRALERALWLAPGEQVWGLGCTASLVSDPPKRGDHRVHVSTAGNDQIRTWSLTLAKGARDRLGEETVAAGLVLHAMAQALGLSAPSPLPLLAEEKIEEAWGNIGILWACLEKTGAVLVGADGRFCTDAPWQPEEPMVLVSGAFNPLHAAHQALAAVAQRREGKRTAFELSVANVDKPALTPAELRRRLGQFVGVAPVWLTRAPRFVDKARLFPGAAFAVGADTALRIVAPLYYEHGEQGLRQALDLIRRQRCYFLVAGRADATGRYQGLDDIPIPEGYRDLFRAIPREDFRLDVSSTLLRERRLS